MYPPKDVLYIKYKAVYQNDLYFMIEEPYTKYEVLKDFKVKSGTIAPWFDEIGGGTQYFTDLTVDELIELGYIRKIK